MVQSHVCLCEKHQIISIEVEINFEEKLIKLDDFEFIINEYVLANVDSTDLYIFSPVPLRIKRITSEVFARMRTVGTNREC